MHTDHTLQKIIPGIHGPLYTPLSTKLQLMSLTELLWESYVYNTTREHGHEIPHDRSMKR